MLIPLFLFFFALTLLLVFGLRSKLGKPQVDKVEETARERSRRIMEDPALQAPRHARF